LKLILVFMAADSESEAGESEGVQTRKSGLEFGGKVLMAEGPLFGDKQTL
jgi:hypothetical protein